MKIKNIIYNFLVRKNKNVQYEYERYVRENLVSHYEHRWRHWKILFKLNIHYQIKKRKEPMLYWDKEIKDIKEPQNTKIQKKNTSDTNIIRANIAEEKDVKKKKATTVLIGPESKSSKRITPVRTALELLQYDVISFDIFDTLIFRSISDPKDLFVLLEKENRIFNFAQLRSRAESEVRSELDCRIGSRDATIYEIYDYIERETGIAAKELIKEEYEIEKKICFANEYMKTIFEILKEQGKKIILISDMYYPEGMMRELLSACGYEGYEKLYVSCDYRMSKRKGDLYKKVKRDFGEETKICHVGDNRAVDIETAEQQGFNTLYYRNVNNIGSKNRPKDMSPLIKSVYSGVINTWIHGSERLFTPQYEYGFIYGGIYVLGYVNWIHQYALDHKLDKVLFLARDSDILKDVYDLLYTDIPSEYLYWGRLPSFKYMLEDDRYGFLERNIQDRVNRKSKITIETLLDLLDVRYLEINLKKYNLKMSDLLSKENAQLVKALFLNYIEDIEEGYRLESMRAKEYVKYVIGNATRIGIVDIGWKGTEPLCLKRLIQEKWKIADDVKCLMAGSYGNKWNVQDGTFDVYMFSQIHNVNNMYFLQKNISYYTLAFELFGRMRCEARFKGFSIKGMDTCMKFEGNLVENHWDMNEICNGINDFVKEYTLRTKEFPFLMNISGFDAYAPSKTLLRDVKYLDNYFGEHRIELDAGDNEGHIRTYTDYIAENKF